MLIGASESLAATAAAIPEGTRAWFVGGAVRDLLLEAVVDDVDIAVDGDAKQLARALHARIGGDIFSLSDRFGTWRVNAAAGWQVDVTGLRGETIEDDLALRDFRANAIAIDVAADSLVDPFDGASDVAARVFRLVGDRAYADDPLRPLRLPRLAGALGFTVDAATADATRAHAADVAQASAERIFAELRGLIGSDDPLRGLALLDELGLTAVVLPELHALKGLEQTVYHHKDVYGHTLEVLERFLELERSNYEIFGPHATPLAELLTAELSEGVTHAGGLRWAALLHDIGKPDTATWFDDGRRGFPRHDVEGAELVRGVCRRLHTSEKFSQYLAALTRRHMQLGWLIPERPLSRRDLHRYFTKCRPVEVEVNVLSVADRMATRGRKHEEGIPRHVELAVEVTEAAIDWRANPPRPPIRGDELARELGIAKGPRIGELLAQIAEAVYAGEVTGRDDAISLARSAL